jgi:tetratricopeptide (TPR) repeat protein
VAALETGLAQQAQQLCENLADRDLIRPAESDRFAFRHILIQEVAYNTLPRTERARLHAEAGRWVESTSEGREVAVAEILAFHYREAAVLGAALDPKSEDTARAKASAGRWLLKAADVAAAAAATPEAVRHIRAAMDFVDPSLRPSLHERIGDMTGGDSGLEDYRLALELYRECEAPVDDQLRALAGMLMVTTRWAGSVGDRPSEEWMDGLRARGRDLLARAVDPRSIGRFLAADAFYPFWLQGVRQITTDELERAEADAKRSLQIATELGDFDLASLALDAVGGIATSVSDWARARETAVARIAFEDKLGLYERLDAHSMVAWMSYLMGDLETADRDSAEMMARLLPGQAPYPALHLFAWRAATLYTLGRWDEAAAAFWRAIEAWHDAGSHAAGYGLRGFTVGLDIGWARGDARLIGAASDAMESVLNRFPADHINRRSVSYLRGESGFTSDDPFLTRAFVSEGVEKRLCLASDRREQLPAEILEAGLVKALEARMPLVEAQVRRARGLAYRDATELTAALAIWDRIGAVPHQGRARAERGLIMGDRKETEAGLAILTKLGDVNYVDRFATGA